MKMFWPEEILRGSLLFSLYCYYDHIRGLQTYICTIQVALQHLYRTPIQILKVSIIYFCQPEQMMLVYTTGTFGKCSLTCKLSCSLIAFDSRKSSSQLSLESSTRCVLSKQFWHAEFDIQLNTLLESWT